MMNNFEDLKQKTRLLREDVIEMIYKAGSGHPGGSLSAAEMIAYLYFYKLNIDPKNPQMAERDRFILSKGHCNPVLYAALAERGYFEKENLWTLRDMGSILQGHPDMNKTPGIDITTGSLGQGLSHGVGMALAARINQLSYKVYVMIGDGELQEGQNWEAAASAAHFSLDHLIAIVDNNKIQCDGVTREVMNVEPVAEKFKLFGFDVAKVNAADFYEIDRAFFEFDYANGRPKCVVMDSVKGCGVSFMENQVCWHGGAPSQKEYERALEEIRGKVQ
jgi:transketolase